jgi:N6-L-threonylcarbamoyladenine synthase
MKILAIETSCDETSLALIEKISCGKYLVHSHETISQMNLHREWGGVYPTLSRREHEKNLIPLLHKVLSDADLLEEIAHTSSGFQPPSPNLGEGKEKTEEKLGENIILLERYPDLKEKVFEFFSKYKLKENITSEDFKIAVTNGPGLPPALWVGVNFAKVVSILLGNGNSKTPLYPINHMEGHIVGAISRTTPSVTIATASPREATINTTDLEALPFGKVADRPEGVFVEISKIKYPVINLLISGGHTELVLSDKNLSYKKIGETQDDAVGECFDKVARMLDLPYPGGPEIGRLAKAGRELSEIPSSDEEGRKTFEKSFWGGVEIKSFPRPMLYSKDLNFSFSGLKTHILYLIQNYKKNRLDILDREDFPEDIKIKIATEFEYTVRDILISKTRKAIEENLAQTLVVGGGVASSPYLRENFEKLGKALNIETYISDKTLSTDNALMIALCAANKIENKVEPEENFLAIGSKHYEWK